MLDHNTRIIRPGPRARLIPLIATTALALALLGPPAAGAASHPAEVQAEAALAARAAWRGTPSVRFGSRPAQAPGPYKTAPIAEPAACAICSPAQT